VTDVGLRQFIHHSNTTQVLTILADVVDAGAMIVLSGHGDPATGKGRLLHYFATKYWRIERDADKDWHPIIYVDHTSLDWSTELLRGSAAPIVAQVLSATMAELVNIAEQYRPARFHARWQQKPRSIATKTQTVWLHNEVYRELKTFRVRALLIDNAESIDGATLQMLVKLRQRLHKNGHKMALIFAARLAKNETLDEPMEHIFARAKVDPRDFEEPIELHVLTRDAFIDEVLEYFIDELEVEFEPDLENYQEFIADALWKRTQGDWKSIDQQVKKFNRLLGRRNGNLRMVTRAIIEQILGQKLPETLPTQE
jgi:hypothetical protein